jgi:hypothetical protein
MLTSAPGALVKNTKGEIFTLETAIFVTFQTLIARILM